MKHIIKYLIVGGLFLGFNSCDILEEHPQDFVSPDSFFTTEDEVKSALYGVYEYLHNIYIGDYEKIFIGDIGVDEMITRQTPRIDVYQYYQFESPSVEWSTYWRDHYAAIGAANMVISRTNASSIDDDFKAKVIAEAKVLRAFFYHGLILPYGDVPLWLDELNISEVSNLSRTPKAKIIEQLNIDLDNAAEVLPSSYESNDLGRVTKWMAKSLQARINILENNWQKAYDLSVDIIKNSPHKLLTDYNQIFDWKNKFNEELIFVVPSLTDVKGSQIHSFTNPRGMDEANKFNKAFENGLKANRPDGTVVSSSGELFQGWGMYSSTKHLLDSYEIDDTRRDIMDWNGIEMSDGTFIEFDGGNGGGSGHYMLKWIAFDEKANNGSRDIHHIRLGEIYLIKAEAANELNKPTEAIDALNALRKRAFGNELHNYPSSLSKAEIKEAIVNENKWELAGEGVRRWYLCHWGFEYLNTAVQSVKDENPRGAANIKPHHILFKIPVEEFIKNPNLGKNNPGY